MRELESLLMCQMSGRRLLYIGNMDGILGIEKLNPRNVFELNLDCYQIN